MRMIRIGRLIAATSALLLIIVPVRADDPAGVLWEMTSQMAMEGMPMAMPAHTVKVCTARQWTRPPPGGNQSCVNTNYRRVGNKATWTMQCSGEMSMTGTGEMTFDGTDSYTGVINATMEGTDVKIHLSGRKIGTCDKPTG
jgi:hypothetical protein